MDWWDRVFGTYAAHAPIEVGAQGNPLRIHWFTRSPALPGAPGRAATAARDRLAAQGT